MVRINREFVLKNFLDKVREAKRLEMREVKIPIRELDDLAYIIYQLMAEEVSKILNGIEIQPQKEQKVEKPINRKVLDSVHVVKKKEEPIKTIKEETQNTIVEEKPIIKEEPKVENQHNEEEDEEDNSLYGGSW